MTDESELINQEGLAQLAIDPDVLARELAAELVGDPLDEIDLDGFDSDDIGSNTSNSSALVNARISF